MTPPPLPANELYRLFTLKRLHLESASVLPFLNSIVQIAHSVFDVPVAFVSAVESERQCFIAKIGLDVETSDRDISICGHVVGTGSALLIPDTRLDPRFADNPFVTAAEKPIIFYAGQPIRLSNEFVIGTLCIVDHQPRTLSEGSFEQLGQMAGLIAEHFELRLKEAHCDRVENLLTRANQILMLIDHKQNSVLSPLSQSARTLLNDLPKITDLKELAPFLPENQQSRYTRQLDQIYKGQADQFHQTIQLTLLNDMVHWFELTISAERDSSGQLLRIFLHLDDITAQKDQQRHLLQTNQRYETILEATETGYWEWDMQDHIIWSAECMKLLGFPTVKTKLSFTEFKEFLHPDDVDILFQNVDDAIKKSHGFSVTFRLKNYLNTYTWVHGKGRVTAYHPNGKPARMMGTHTNIDNLIKLQEDLQRKQEQAEQSAIVKSQFIANVSHEFRTPLNAIIGLSHLLGSTGLDHQQQDYLRKLEQASKSLLLIVNELLDFTKVNAGKVKLENATFLLYEPFEYVINIFEHKIQKKKLDFIVNINALKNIWVVGDGLRLQQVLSNLISNAIKFTDYGHIRLEANIRTQGQQYVLDVCVADTGIGMSEAQVASLFEPFYQADSSTTRRFGGTGLGLTISQAFIKQMGGAICVESQPGEGTIFSFSIELPIGQALTQQLTRKNNTARYDFTNLDAWIVEDNLMNQQIMQELFDEQALNHSMFESGEQLLAYIKHQATKPPTMIILDYNLTGLTGLETLIKIRKLPHYQTIPTIILSAADLSAEIAAIQDPFLRGMMKPFAPDMLFNEIAKLTETPRLATTPNRDSQDNMPIDLNTLPDLEGFNFNDALIYLGGSKDLLIRLLEDYYKRYRSMGNDITLLINQENWQQLRNLLHSFKGISEALGSYAISQRVTKMEKMLLDQAKNASIPDDEFKLKILDSFTDCKNVCQHRFDALGNFLFERKNEENRQNHSVSMAPVSTDSVVLDKKLQHLKQNLATFDGNSLTIWQDLEKELSLVIPSEQLDKIDELINLFEFDAAHQLLESINLSTLLNTQ